MSRQREACESVDKRHSGLPRRGPQRSEVPPTTTNARSPAAHAAGLLAFVLLRGSLYNPNDPCKKLIRIVEKGGLWDLRELDYNPRDRNAPYRSARRLTEEQLRDLVADYKTGTHTVYTLAAKYKVHRHKISAVLRSHGLTLGRTPMSEAEVERARTLQAQGLSWNVIGKTIGRDPKTAKAACTAADQHSVP